MVGFVDMDELVVRVLGLLELSVDGEATAGLAVVVVS